MAIDRQQLLAYTSSLGLVVLLLVGCSSVSPEPAATPTRVPPTPTVQSTTPSTKYYRFMLGDVDCVCLYDGSNRYSLTEKFDGAPLEQVQEALRQHNLPTVSAWSPYTMLYVDMGEHQVLVDMGMGRLALSMKEAGIDPGQIDAVIITHAHPDHIARALDSKGEPLYTNASHYVSKDEWDYWMSEDPPPEGSSWSVQVARKSLEGLQDRLNLLEGEAEIVPGIRAIPAPGHTPGHMIVSVTSGDEELLYIADAATHILHLEYPDWHSAYDVAPDQAIATKRRIFDRAAAEETLVVGTHFAPFPSLGTVVKKGEGWQWQPIEIGDANQP